MNSTPEGQTPADQPVVAGEVVDDTAAETSVQPTVTETPAVTNARISAEARLGVTGRWNRW